jgi:hypothetical protein
MKSGGNRPGFRFTACRRTRVSTFPPAGEGKLMLQDVNFLTRGENNRA